MTAIRITLTALAATALTFTTTAAANPAPSTVAPSVTTVTRADFRLIPSSQARTDNLISQRIAEFLAVNTTRSRLALTADDVRVWQVPQDKGLGDIMAITTTAEAPDELRAVTGHAAGADDNLLAMKWAPPAEDHPVGTRLDTTRGEIGDRRYAVKLAGASRVIWHNPSKVANPNNDPKLFVLKKATKIVDTWEKFRSTVDARGYAYNRSTLFTPGETHTNLLQMNVTDPSIRFRQWHSSNSIRNGPQAWTPRPEATCNQRQQKLSFHGAEVQIPYVWCDSTTKIDPDPSKTMFGVMMDVRARDQKQLDGAATFEAFKGSSNITLSDNIWYVARTCNNGLWSCTFGTDIKDYPYKWTDGGW